MVGSLCSVCQSPLPGLRAVGSDAVGIRRTTQLAEAGEPFSTLAMASKMCRR